MVMPRAAAWSKASWTAAARSAAMPVVYQRFRAFGGSSALPPDSQHVVKKIIEKY